MLPPEFKVVRFIVACVPLQNTCGIVGFTWPVGFIIISNVIGAPLQFNPPLLKVGITIIVATWGTVPVLIAVNGRIFPVPSAANPIVVLLFVQA